LAAVAARGTTTIINAALEPEVCDLIDALKKMGAHIEIHAPAHIEIHGGYDLHAIDHEIIPDRLEAGALLCATAVTGGYVYLEQARADHMEIFLQKLSDMGHHITVGKEFCGIELRATKTPHAVSFKTGPYPGFPTDLQAPMMVLQTLAQGTSIIEETVFENRFLHVQELKKMGAHIKVEYNRAMITGVEALYGAHVIATDIRASCALFLAGLVAQGTTRMSGVQHWRRGYENLELKIQKLGGSVTWLSESDYTAAPESDIVSLES
jgi:UDP-N-acetylglucosamine 1-carboxyvinyltransferase